MLPDRSLEVDHTRLDLQEHREERVARAEGRAGEMPGVGILIPGPGEWV